MALYTIAQSGNALRITNSGGDTNPTMQYADTISWNGDSKIKFYMGGNYVTSLLFNEIEDIGGSQPADVQEATTLIDAIIANFSTGGGASSNTSVVPYFATLTYDDSGFISVPANTVILSVYNVSDGVQLTESTQWAQSSAGSNVNILGGAADLDVLQLTGLTYANVAPPEKKEAVLYLSQGGTDAPTIEAEAINTIGTITTSYDSQGVFILSKTGGFDPVKTFVTTGFDVNSSLVRWFVIETGGLAIFTNGENDALGNTPIKIETYN